MDWLSKNMVFPVIPVNLDLVNSDSNPEMSNNFECFYLWVPTLGHTPWATHLRPIPPASVSEFFLFSFCYAAYLFLIPISLLPSFSLLPCLNGQAFLKQRSVLYFVVYRCLQILSCSYILLAPLLCHALNPPLNPTINCNCSLQIFCSTSSISLFE